MLERVGGRRLRASVTAAAAWLALASLMCSSAGAAALPGPPLTVSQSQLNAAVSCMAGTNLLPGNPVLLVHGALGDGGEWDGNYGLLLPKDGFGVCTVTVPGRDEGDLTVAVQYVVNAIRVAHGWAGRPIDIIAHSAGALLSTDALKFWPDLAGDVRVFVGLSGVYGNGTDSTVALCDAVCPVAARQIEAGSAFLHAYASRPLYSGPSYTAIATADDELVFPQPQAGYLAGGENITLQRVCPGLVVDHIGIVLNGAAFALALDALEHGSVADPGRITRRAVCSQVLTPGINLGPFGTEVANTVVPIVGPFITQDEPEPAPPCYMSATCARSRLAPTVHARATVRRDAVVITGVVVLPAGAIDQCAGRITVAAVDGGAAIGTNSTPVDTVSCGFSDRVMAQRRRGGVCVKRQKLAVRYRGDAELAPSVTRLLVTGIC